MCLFHQKVIPGQDIHEGSTFNAGEQPQDADPVKESNIETWKFHLSEAITAADAQLINIKYHLLCWVKHA